MLGAHAELVAAAPTEEWAQQSQDEPMNYSQSQFVQAEYGAALLYWRRTSTEWGMSHKLEDITVGPDIWTRARSTTCFSENPFQEVLVCR